MKKTEIIKEIENEKISASDLIDIVQAVQHRLERMRMVKEIRDKNWRANFKRNLPLE